MIRSVVVSIVSWIFLFANSLFGQVSFSVNTTEVSLSHPANTPVFYQYISLSNNTNQPLTLQWKIVGVNLPTAWEIGIEDPDSFYMYPPDSATFVLPDTSAFGSRLIVSFRPENIVSRGNVVLKVSNINTPEDSVLLTWNAATYDTGTSVYEVSEEPEDYIKVSLMGGNQIMVRNNHPSAVGEAAMYDVSGKLLYSVQLAPGESQTRKLEIKGIVIVRIEQEGKNATIKLGLR